MGKTHLAVALGREAIVAGHTVLFSGAMELVANLAKAQADGRLAHPPAECLIWIKAAHRPPLHAGSTIETRRLDMIRLAMILHAVIGTSLMGAAVVVALVTGNDTLQAIGLVALVGFLAAIPASLAMARQIS